MSDVQYVQYWTKYVQYWTNTAISQQPDYVQGWFWCQNYCQITGINIDINFSNISRPICLILDNMSNIRQIQLYLSNQTMYRAGFGVEITV